MTGRARRERESPRVGAGCLRAGRLVAVTAAITLVISVLPASAAHRRLPHTDAATADAIVEKLRELPLPVRALPQGVASANARPQPLPTLEAKRQEVYDQLHALGPASVPALARALRDPDPEMRRHVAVALDVVGGGWWQFPDGGTKLDLRPALPALLTALGDSDPDVRSWAAQDIGDIGGGAVTAVPRLRGMLHSPDPGSRGSACNALGGIGAAARGALPDLRRALADSSPEVQQAARNAIVSIERAGAAAEP